MFPLGRYSDYSGLYDDGYDDEPKEKTMSETRKCPKCGFIGDPHLPHTCNTTIDSEFERQFPKPSDYESPAVILRWESRREGYLATLKRVQKLKGLSAEDIMQWIRMEIAAVEKEKK